MKSGILIIDKGQNKTSRDLVNEICKKFQTKKVGHTGTLDPLATGVLVVGVNEGTKLIPFLMSDDKEYIAEAILGVDSDTLDITGNMVEKNTKIYSIEEIENALKSFLGTYEQEVPKYSAVHINGKRLYEYARENQEVCLPKRNVEIKNMKLLEVHEEDEHQFFSFQVTVSKGTYIRSLIRDIGIKLGSYCIMKNLRRTRQGIFDIQNAKKIEAITEKDLIPLGQALSNYPKKVIENKKMLFQIQNGAKLPNEIEGLTCFTDKEENLLAIYQPTIDKIKMRPVKVFTSQNNPSQK